MLERWRRKRENRAVVDRAYEAVVARARDPRLYETGGLPDTVLGRYEALGIEVFLLMGRCRADPVLHAFSQDLVDRFMLDLDHSLREIGIGYQGVPRRMRRLASRFYARVAAYEAPIAAQDEAALAEALDARAYGEFRPAPGASRWLARHILARADEYVAVPAEAILSGRIEPSREAA